MYVLYTHVLRHVREGPSSESKVCLCIYFSKNWLKQLINLLGIMDKGNKKDNSKVYTEIKINVDTSDAHTTGERQNITLSFSVTS